jgi:tripartite ATP-independent transporter DctM subunit
MSPEMLGLVFVCVLSVALFAGFPIAFTLIIMSLVFGYIGFGIRVFDLMVYQYFSLMEDPLWAAVPLFLFMGLLLEEAGLMERLFKAFQLLLAPVRGSLYLAVALTAAIFATATGIVGASVVLLGVMAAPTMNKCKYDVRMSAGIITAGGTLGILIPPSVMLVVMGPVVGVSVVDLFAAAILPGLLLAGLFGGYALVRSRIQPHVGPALPKEERASSFAFILLELSRGLIPPAGLVMACLGSILFGWATPTEGAAMGAFGAFILILAYRRFTWARFYKAGLQTLQVSGMVVFLVGASNFFGAVFSRLGTPAMITKALVGLGLGPTGIILIVLLLVFLLGWPLEWIPIVLIVIPIVLPVIRAFEINLVWFSILVAVCLQTAWLSPPVALASYWLKGVVPEWDLKDIYIGMLEFMVLQALGTLLLLFLPQIVLWLPSVLSR